MSPNASCSFVSSRSGGRVHASLAADGSVRTAHDCQNARDIEALLREHMGLSARAAKRVAPAFWAALMKCAAELDEEELDSAIADGLDRLNQILKGTQS